MTNELYLTDYTGFEVGFTAVVTGKQFLFSGDYTPVKTYLWILYYISANSSP